MDDLSKAMKEASAYLDRQKDDRKRPDQKREVTAVTKASSVRAKTSKLKARAGPEQSNACCSLWFCSGLGHICSGYLNTMARTCAWCRFWNCYHHHHKRACCHYTRLLVGDTHRCDGPCLNWRCGRGFSSYENRETCQRPSLPGCFTAAWGFGRILC